VSIFKRKTSDWQQARRAQHRPAPVEVHGLQPIYIRNHSDGIVRLECEVTPSVIIPEVGAVFTARIARVIREVTDE